MCISKQCTSLRKTVAAILQGISPIKFAMFKNNPEEFITKVIRLIKEQKATMIVEHISYDQIEGTYDSSIFTAEKHASFDKAYRAEKHIQDYVFTDGTAEKSVERMLMCMANIGEWWQMFNKNKSKKKPRILYTYFWVCDKIYLVFLQKNFGGYDERKK